MLLRKNINKMKKLITILIMLPLLIMAQAPQGFTYQGVATDNNGFELQNQTISIQASILSSSATGTTVWQETHTTTTDTFGLFNVTIGEGTSTNSGSSATFQEIDWGAASHFMKVEIDVNGGTNYVHVGTSQMMSVPYALYAENVHNLNMDSILGAVYDSINASGTMSVSIIGDTLTMNGQSIIVPGISYQNTPSSAFGSVADIDGNTYQTIDLGLAGEWMIEDLRTTSFSNGDPINLITGSNNTGSSICHSPGYIEHYNVIYYNGYTIDDSRSVCPTGWSVPTILEYEVILDVFNEGDPSNNNSGTSYGKEWDNAGKALKSTEASPNGSHYWSQSSNNNYSYLNFLLHNVTSCSDANTSNVSSNHSSWSTSDGIYQNIKWVISLQDGTDKVRVEDATYAKTLTTRCIKD
jgi:uncharacterized protein (TIGR02145 family)